MLLFLQTLFRLSIEASFLMLTLYLLRPLLKKAPPWITGMAWALCAVRLLCPFSVESALSLMPRADTVSGAISATASTGVPAVAPAPAEAAGRFLPTVLVAVWAFGAAAMCLYAAISYIRLYCRLRVSVCDGDNVFLCDRVRAPFVFGMFRPRIYLPSDIAETKKEHILQHEYAHLARGDQFWKPLGFFILSVYWFHPLVWVSYVLFCKDIELACDARVVRQMSLSDKKAYSETLLACSVSSRKIAACPLSFAETSVKTRIKSILCYRKPTVSVAVLSVVAVAAVAVCLMTAPKSEPPVEVQGEAVVLITEFTTEAPTEPVTETVTETVTEPTAENTTTVPTTEPTAKKKKSKTTTTTTEPATESRKQVGIPLEPPEIEPTVPYSTTRATAYETTTERHGPVYIMDYYNPYYAGGVLN